MAGTYICDNGHSMRKTSQRVYLRCRCGKLAQLQVNVPFHVGAFKAYTEENLTGKAIRIETREQRDALCEKHGVTYDSVKYVRPKKPRAAIEDISLDDVKQAIQTGRTPDGEKLEAPTKISKAELARTKKI